MTEAWTKEKLSEAVAANNTWTGVLRHLGFKYSGGAIAQAKKKVAEFGLDTSHFKGRRWRDGEYTKPHERTFKPGRKPQGVAIEEHLMQCGDWPFPEGTIMVPIASGTHPSWNAEVDAPTGWEAIHEENVIDWLALLHAARGLGVKYMVMLIWGFRPVEGGAGVGPDEDVEVIAYGNVVGVVVRDEDADDVFRVAGLITEGKLEYDAKTGKLVSKDRKVRVKVEVVK